MELLDRTVFMIDDDMTTLAIQKLLINKWEPKANVITESNPSKALEFIEKEGDKIDLVLLDLNMPDIDGWMIIERILAGNSMDVRKVCLFTSSVDKADYSRASELGIGGFISKPMTKEVLDEALNSERNWVTNFSLPT